MRSLLTISLLIVALAGCVFGQRQVKVMKSYKLFGNVVGMDRKLSDDKSNLEIKLSIEYELKNTGEKDLFILKDRNDRFSPRYIGQTVSKTLRFYSNDILLDRVGGDSVSIGAEWEKLRSQLNVQIPPMSALLAIKPSASIKFSADVYILAKEPFRGKTGGDIDLSSLRSITKIWMKTKFQVWSFNLEPDKNYSNRKFGKMLQSRWERFGCLMVDDLISEPMEINL